HTVSDRVAAVKVLREGLEDLADALTCADLNRLLACEARLDAALAHLRMHNLTDAPPPGLAHEVQAAHDALTRCRRLGHALGSLVELGLSAHGVDQRYGPGAARTADDFHSIHRTA